MNEHGVVLNVSVGNLCSSKEGGFDLFFKNFLGMVFLWLTQIPHGEE